MSSNGLTCQPDSHEIVTINYQSGDEICYSVVVVKGVVKAARECSFEKCIMVEQINGPWYSPPSTKHLITDNRHFKCILKLERGCNTFVLTFCSVKLELILHCKPRVTQFCVLPIYVICKGHDGRFQAPEHEDNSIESACDRISTGMHLLQSLYAEELNKFGSGRRTFQLQTDLDPTAPDCHVFYSDICVEEAHAADGDTLWSWLGRELMSSNLGKENHKFVAFLSSTFYEGKAFTHSRPTQEDVVRCTQGHVAVGGGGLALVHTGCLFTWATSIEEVVSRLSSTSRVDTEFFMDISNDRGTYGSCYSTSLGIVAHELGHTFDLGHTSHGIMGLEYHNAHRMFLQEVDPSAPNESPEKKSQVTGTPQNIAQNPRLANSDARLQSCQLTRYVSQARNLQSEIHIVKELKVAWRPPESARPTPKNQKAIYVNAAVADNESSPLDLSCENSIGECQNLQAKENLISKTQRNAQVHDEDNFHPVLDHQDCSDFFAKGCLALLTFNKWINSERRVTLSGCLTFDRVKRLITSQYGLRVIEIRDATCRSLLHWIFLQNTELVSFCIPELWVSPEAKSICVIDSLGNVIKPDLKELDC